MVTPTLGHRALDRAVAGGMLELRRKATWFRSNMRLEYNTRSQAVDLFIQPRVLSPHPGRGSLRCISLGLSNW